MKRLILLRHAKATAADGRADHDRELAPRGLADAAWAGETIKTAGWMPEVALVSDALRTRQTFAAALPHLDPPPVLRIEPALYEAGVDGVLAIIATAPADARCLLVIGHNPSLAVLARRLAQSGDAVARSGLAGGFPTAAIAVFALSLDGWRKIGHAPSAVEAFLTPAGPAG